ncbi:Metalloendopeptidase-like membrane protein (modular protein) (fragment) [metagenome]|uniref:Metalloendopeptidase-like membrane protein (Modular protein) n=1 Tax=metagenome TaxID=256318 RepID=A0A2P2CCS7_9ZZZZ
MSSPVRQVIALRRPAVVSLVTLVATWALGAPTSAAPPGADPVGVWPLTPQPNVVAGFDPPDDPFGAGHRGVDLAGTAGQRVRSAMAGRITFAGRIAGRGVVVVEHGGSRTTYEPVTPLVDLGAEVDAGQPIARLDLVGSHCFPAACLHWGWLRDTTYLDPLALVGGGPVRLLPLALGPAPA